MCITFSLDKIMDVCRACLSKDDEMFPLDNNFTVIYNLLTNLNVMLDDEFPQHCCKSCMDAVKYFWSFRIKCITSESTLRAVKLENVNPEKLLLGENKQVATNFNIEGVDVKIEYEETVDDINEESYENLENLDLSFVIKNENHIQPKRSTRCKKGNNMVKLKLEPKARSIKAKYKQLLYCGICNNSFIDQNLMSNHVETHRKDRKCEICSEIFGNWPQLLSHRMVHLPKKQKMCHICPKRCATIMSMEYHYLKIHYEQKKFMGLQCKQCTSFFETPRKLSRHSYAVHSTKIFICDYCSKRTNNKQKLVVHIKSHSENKAFTCDLCGFSCRYSSGLKNHKIRKHSLTKVYCNKCKAAFHGEVELNHHKCNVPLRICPVCGKQFRTSNAYSRHTVTHEDIGKYKCDRCPAVYKSRTGLLVHRDRHDGNRSKQCEYCPAKFYSLGVLIKHRRIHTGEKPFVCKICSKGFTGRHNLKVHMKVHGEMLIVKKNKADEVVKNI